MALEGPYALLRLPSGELRNVPCNCMATIGVVGNADHANVKIGKAGRKRNMGFRPTVRGSVMNPTTTRTVVVKVSPPSAVPVLAPLGASLLWVIRPAARRKSLTR